MMILLSNSCVVKLQPKRVARLPVTFTSPVQLKNNKAKSKRAELCFIMIKQRIRQMAVTKVTLVDSPEKMRPQKSPSVEYSILMGANVRTSLSDTSTKPKENKETPAK